MHLLMLGAWPELAERLVGLPARVTLIQPPGVATAREAAWAHRYVELDYHDHDKAIEVAERIHHADPVDAVVSFRELALPALAAVAARLGVRSISGPVETLPRTKNEVRALLNAGGCRVVRHRVCESEDDLAAFAAECGHSVVVKPSVAYVMGGAHGVAGPEDVAPAWRHVTAATEEEILAEERLIGPEFSVEVRSVDGEHEVVMVTGKQHTGMPYFIEVGHVVPAAVGADDHAAIVRETVWALTAAGHRTGPSHVEVILTEDGPAIVEINRRLAGDRIWELIQLATGRDLMTEVLLDAAGLPPSPTHRRAGGAAIAYLVADAQRRVAAELPVDAANSVDGLIRVKFTARPSSVAHTPDAPHSRLGYVMTVAETGEAAAEAAERAKELVLQQLFAH